MPKHRLPNFTCVGDKDLEAVIPGRGLTSEKARRLADEAVKCLLDCPASDDILYRATMILCRLAIHSDAAVAREGLQGLFPFLAERLSDAFDPLLAALYDRVFAEVICFCRRLPAGKAIDQALNRFGLRSKADLLLRKKSLANRSPLNADDLARYRKCIVLSRVTLGADIAVTSVVIAKLLEGMPHAEVVLIGDRNISEIFCGIPRFRVRHYAYALKEGLLAKINGWVDTLAVVDEEIRGFPDSACLIIDPDSRLTQLGLLPLVENEKNYLFFESRSYRQPDMEKIGSLTSRWLMQHLGGSDRLPFISLSAENHDFARRFRSRVTSGKNILTSISLGVGGNEKKRLGLAFEIELLKRILHYRNNTILLFKGIGREVERTAILLDALSAMSDRPILSVSEHDLTVLPCPDQPAGIVAWEGPLREYCALIAASDIQIGYDSSNQHIAAACGVPTIDIFADDSTPMFLKRWAPHGAGPVKIVAAFGGHIAEGGSAGDRQAPNDSLRIDSLDPLQKHRIETALQQTIGYFHEFLKGIRYVK